MVGAAFHRSPAGAETATQQGKYGKSCRVLRKACREDFAPYDVKSLITIEFFKKAHWPAGCKQTITTNVASRSSESAQRAEYSA
jgi:hypothetical protein